MLFVNDQIETWIVVLVVVGVLILGTGLFFLTGFIFISKTRVGIIEKVGKYIGTYKSGLYYFMPVLYRRVGYYKIGETVQKFKIDRKEYILRYQIEDFEKFHYIGNHDAYGIVCAALKSNTEDLSKYLITRFKDLKISEQNLSLLKS